MKYKSIFIISESFIKIDRIMLKSRAKTSTQKMRGSKKLSLFMFELCISTLPFQIVRYARKNDGQNCSVSDYG